MRLFTPAAAIVALTIAVSPAIAQRRAAPAMTVATVNGESVLRYRDQTLARPFGATLVDRLDVAGAYSIGRNRAFLIRGTATGACPVQYVVVEFVGGSPRTSAPFGTCADGARARATRAGLQITLPGGSFAYRGGSVTALTPAPMAGPALAVADSSAPWAGPGGCAMADRTDASPDVLLADFERGYPADWRRPGRLNRLEFDSAELERVVIGLACLSTWPAAEPSVPKAATPLFASKKHGRRAFDLLETIARDANAPQDLRVAARVFHAEMRFRVERREPL